MSFALRRTFLALFLVAGCRTSVPERDSVPALVGAWRAKVQFTSGSLAPVEDLEYWFFTTRADEGAWVPAGSGVLIEKIALATDGRSYESTLTLELFDAAGKPVEGGGAATVHAQRAGF